jgi:hypothetical protein
MLLKIAIFFLFSRFFRGSPLPAAPVSARIRRGSAQIRPESV